MQDLATFSLFVRALPAPRGFVVAAGLQDALDRTSSVSKSPRGRLRAGGSAGPRRVLRAAADGAALSACRGRCPTMPWRSPAPWPEDDRAVTGLRSRSR